MAIASKILSIVLASAAMICGQSAGGQSAGAPEASTGSAPTPEAAGDRFSALRENADRLKHAYEVLDQSSTTEIDRLLGTRRCQINRIGGLLDRVEESLNQYMGAENGYWLRWSEVETKTVETQQKSLASFELEQARIKQNIESETADHELLLRKRALLEQHGKRTEAILKELDDLVADIRDSEAKLTEAQKKYEEITSQVTSMNVVITGRLVHIRQENGRVLAWGAEVNAYYEDKRKEANQICNMKQPNSGPAALPKRKSKP